MIEHLVYCPHCNAQDFVLLDINRPNHDYRMDCEVCENIIQISLDFTVNQYEEALYRVA